MLAVLKWLAVRLAVVLAVALAGWLPTGEGAGVPRCAEDDVIVGTGDYADGRWDGYVCGHPDTLDGGVR